VTLTERIDQLETDARNAFDRGDYAIYDLLIAELRRLEEERDS
jgi:hypothetical protein